jgi:hypothetical protein
MPNLPATFRALFLLACLAAPLRAHAQLAEGFDDITTLGGNGWVLKNRSAPPGVGWSQGNDLVFPANSGGASSYIAANFESVGDGGGTISNWLLTPVLSLTNGWVFSFFTRTVAPTLFPDRLELRLSTAGTSENVGDSETSVGDFSTLLLSVNPDLTETGYPTDWTQYSVTLSDLTASQTGRFALRYFVTEAGGLLPNGDYIGIDDVSYTARAAVPEPAPVALLGVGLAAIAFSRRRHA